MKTYKDTFNIKTKGFSDILDITRQVSAIVRNSGIEEGQVHVSVAGSTAAITSIEFESGVVRDLNDAIERMAPRNIKYYHDARWGDGNGFAHVRAAMIGSFATFALTEGKMFIGTWQQIVLIDFDNNPRNRSILVQIMGERNDEFRG